MATVDTLLVEVTADLKDVRRKLGQLEKDTKRTGDRSAKNMDKLGTAIKAVVGAVAVREFARASLAAVNFASHVEEMQAKSGVVFGQFASEVRADLKAFGDEVGRSRFQLEEMAASVQDTFVPMGFARGEAADLSVQLAKLATDVASFNNASDTETMRAFQSALVGNHETVRRFGIVITEAELQAELFRMGITKSKDQITAAEKVQARLNLILAGTTDAQGDAARTADSYANQVKAMEASIDELKAAIGTEMMPVFLDFVKTIKDASQAVADFMNAGKPDMDSVKGISEAQVELRDRMAENRAEMEKMEEQNLQNTAGYRLLSAESANLTAEMSNQEAALARIILRKREEAAANKAAADSSGAADPTDAALGQGTTFFQAQTDEANLLMQALMGVTDAKLALFEAEQGGAAFTQEQIDGYKRQAAAIDEMKLKMQGIEEINSLIEGSAKQLASGISQSMADMVTGVTSGMEGLKDIVGNIIGVIIKKLIELAIVNKMVNAAMGFFGAPQSAMLPTFASGGSMQANKPALVGERGPELIIPKSASVVKNAADTRGMVGGGTPVVVNQSLNFSTGVQATVRNEVMALMPQIQESTKAAVAEQAQRGGSFTRAF
jgi:hypothetical protein